MRKNCFRTLLAAALMTLLLSLPAYAESAVVTGDDVNVREGPGTNYRVLDCLPRNASVTVSDRSNAAWYQVEYDGGIGFMSSAYLDVSEEQHAAIYLEPAPSAGEQGYVNAMYVRFRSGPGSEFSILGEYNRGKALSITGSTGAWTACTIDGRAGYLYSDYVSFGSLRDRPDEYSGDAVIELPAAPPPTAAPAPTPDGILLLDDPAPTRTPAPAPTAAPAPTPAARPVTAAQILGEGSINGSYVRFRTGPSTSYQIIDTYNAGTALSITGSYEGWTACIINGVFGYVHSDYVTVTSSGGQASAPPLPGSITLEEPAATPTPVTPTPVTAQETKEGYVCGNNVRMRGGASMSSPIVTELSYGNRVSITGTAGDWTAVIYDGTPGFIYSQFVREGSFSVGGLNDAGGIVLGGGSSGSELGRQIAQFALQYVGYNYSWGGKAPETGFDCSGLVYYTYQNFGYTLNRVAQDQARNGVHVEPDELQPGDILCFYSGSSYIGHSGIYIGDNKFVHAQNSATGVVITELSGYYATRGFEARRIV